MKKLLPIVKLNEEHYDNGDGTFTANIYGQPIYYNENGKLKHIKDYRLTDGTDVTNGSDLFNVKVRNNTISYKLDGKTTKTEVLGLYLDDTILHELSDKVVGDNYIQWKLGDKVDYKLTITPYTVREEIIFKSNPLVGIPIDGEKIYIKYSHQGKLKTKEPYCSDARGLSIPITIADDRKGIDTRQLYTHDYPITLDPTTSPNPTSDAYVTNGITKYDNTSVMTGYYAYDSCGTPVIDNTRGYLRFDLSSLAGATINSAILNIYKIGGVSTARVMGISAVGEVDPEAGSAGSVYSGAGTGSVIGDLTHAVGSYQTLTVTSHVNTHTGGFCDFGLLREHYNSATAENFYSSEGSSKPYLSVDYTEGGTPAPAFLQQVIFIG